MKRISNRKSRSSLEGKVEFQGSNLSGKWEGGIYVVRSYKWYVLFIYVPTLKSWYGNKEKYSASTSRQASNCRPLHEAVVEVSHDEIKNLLRNHQMMVSA